MAKDDDDRQRPWTPIPDPTLLTTDQLRREILSLREILEGKITNVETKVASNREITRETLVLVDVKFNERDKALAAALLSAKEAVVKSEANTHEALSQLRELFMAESKATNTKVDDLRDARNRGEGHTGGSKDMWGYLVGVIGLVAALAAVAVAILKH
jgi:hypothetical protein